MRLSITAALVLAWICLSVAPASGQGAPASTRDALEALEKDLQALRKQTVQIPTLADAVQELSTRLAELSRRLDTLERQGKAIPNTLGRLDELDKEVESLTLGLESLRTRLADLSRPPESDSGGVSHDGGFAWATDDGRYSLTIGGYVQPRIELGIHGADYSDDSVTITSGDIDTATLRLRRARLGLSGHVGGDRVAFKVLLSALGERPALDYYLDYRVVKNLMLRVGQYKTQFSRSFITSSTRLAFIDRPAAVDGLRYDRDIQVGAHGKLLADRLGYYVGIGNGAGRNTLNDNREFNVTGRVDATLLGERFKYGYGDLKATDRPTLMIGAGAVGDLVSMPDSVDGIAVETDVDGDGDHDNVLVISASVDAVFRYRRFEAAVEALFRHEDFGTILDENAPNRQLRDALGDPDDRTHIAYVGQVTYFLPQRILVGARVARSRIPFLGVGGRSSRIPRGDHLLELSALAQLYNRGGSRTLGLFYNLDRYSVADDDRTLTGPDQEHRLVLEGQLRF